MNIITYECCVLVQLHVANVNNLGSCKFYKPHPLLSLPAPAVSLSQNPPSFLQGTYSATINQNARAGDTIVTVACSPQSAALTYLITASDPAELAAVNASTGVVSLTEDGIDLVERNYTVSLRCLDGGGTFATALLEIARVTENEYSPQFRVGDTVVDTA